MKNTNIFAGVSLILFSSFAVAGQGLINGQEYTKQEQVIQLQQQALTYYNQGGDLKQFESKMFLGVTIKGNLDVVEASFQKSVLLEPERLDLEYDLASVQVLNNHLDKALETYRTIEQKTPNNSALLSYQAGYSSIAANPKLANLYLKELKKQSTTEAKSYVHALNTAKYSFNLPINQIDLTTIKNINGMVIVILGYALHADGTMDDKLIDRLNVGLNVATHYPTAKIIVSGGVAQGGVTESYLMKQWLIAHGIESNQIILEDKSTDTVANALNSLKIINHLLPKTNEIALVSSASHIRRAYSVFSQAAYNLNLPIMINNQVAMDWKTNQYESATQFEKSLIIRDTLRTAGLWAFPAMQR